MGSTQQIAANKKGNVFVDWISNNTFKNQALNFYKMNCEALQSHYAFGKKCQLCMIFRFFNADNKIIHFSFYYMREKCKFAIALDLLK